MPKVIFNGTAYRIYGELPAIGSLAPDVSLVNTDLQDVSLSAFADHRKIMNIFPSIDTPVCAKSVLVFSRLADKYPDITNLMISYDLPFAHARFYEAHGLNGVVGLSAIRHAGFGENYGVQIEEGPLAGMFSRAVVVLDENNTVVYREHVDDIGDEPDYRAAYKSLGIQLGPDAFDFGD